jgi:hypothetical protein
VFHSSQIGQNLTVVTALREAVPSEALVGFMVQYQEVPPVNVGLMSGSGPVWNLDLNYCADSNTKLPLTK